MSRRWRSPPDGLLAGIKPGAAWFDLSTNSPSLVKKLYAAFAEKGAHMLDAPVSGGPQGAASRKLAIWVGGDKAAFDTHKAALDAIGDQAALHRADRQPPRSPSSSTTCRAMPSSARWPRPSPWA